MEIRKTHSLSRLFPPVNSSFFHRLLYLSSLEASRDTWLERYHNPKFFTTTMNPVVDIGTDTKREGLGWTPDFRVEEPKLEARDAYWYESHRPFRISPHQKTTSYMNKYYPHFIQWQYGCYCTTVYRRYRLLAGCALLTHRHIVTSAAATHLVLRRHRKAPTLENILGAWYDHKKSSFNSSMYMTPARIHYHPLFTIPRRVNRSHPFPIMWDMAVWTATTFMQEEIDVCNRAGPHKWDLGPSTPFEGSQYNMMGYQFIRAYNRRPMPWFKYTVRVEYTDAVVPCPKNEWGWFQCYKTGSWAPLGMDVGAGLHRRVFSTHRHSGTIGLNTISLRLRSVQMISYFNDLNVHKALDFLYDAYNGRLQNVYLDSRFIDTFKRPPKPKPGAVVKDYSRVFGKETEGAWCCFPVN